MMLGGRTVQQCLATAVLFGSLPILALLNLWIVLVAFTVTNATSGAVLFAGFVIVLVVFAPVLARMIDVFVIPIAAQFKLLILARNAPRPPTLGTPGVSPIFVPNVNRKAINRLVLSTFLTRFHRIPFAIPFSK